MSAVINITKTLPVLVNTAGKVVAGINKRAAIRLACELLALGTDENQLDRHELMNTVRDVKARGCSKETIDLGLQTYLMMFAQSRDMIERFILENDYDNDNDYDYDYDEED